MKKILPVWLGMVWSIGILLSPAWGGYVWNTDGDISYAGTGGNWTEDVTVSGTVIRDCTVSVTDTSWSINGTTDDHLTVENASVLFQNHGSVRMGTESDATLTIGDGGKVYWYTDDDGSYGYVNVAATGYKATINILKGGSLEVLRNYFGNRDSEGSTSEVVLNVAGGNLAYVGSRQHLRLGWHNPATITISQGGTISSTRDVSIAESGNTSKYNPSQLTMVGESYVKAGSRFVFGTQSYGAVTLSILANASGMGNIEANTYQQGSYGTVVLGVDHAMTGLKQDTFTIVKASTYSGWQEKREETALWNTRTENGAVEAFLNPARRQGGEDFALKITDDWLFTDISDELASNGWWWLEPSNSYYALELSLDVVDVEALVDWYNESDSSVQAEVWAENMIRLSGFSPDISIFAWDFSGYEPEDVSLLSVGARNVPEPATWGMLLGMAGWLLGWQIGKRREK